MKKILKKITSLIVAISVAFTTLGVLPVSAACEVGAVGDGWGYFFFRATGLDSTCKIAYQVNGGEKVFLESDFQANWVRIDKKDLKTDGENTITLYTGDEYGILDENKSRTDAGTDCCDYTVTTARLALVLPDGRVICKDTWGALKQEGAPFTITTYTPVDDTTVLSNGNTTAEFTGAQLQIGDDKITKAYKADITFNTSLWDGTADPDPVVAPTLKNVSIQIGATPSDRRFVWYSKSENTGYLQYTTSDKLVDGAMPSDATSVTATSSVSGDTDYYSFMADISGLADNTTYAYRVGNDDAWSEVYTFKTDDGENPFSFIVGSDIQLGQLQEYDFKEDSVSGVQKEIDGWVDTYNKISEKNPNASFFISLGDQVSDAYIESQFDGLFAPEQMTSIPFVPVYGNHDDEYSWQKHYNLPNTTEYGANNYGACDYSFVYGDALFMHLTYSNLPEQHTAFIEETMKKHPDVKWRIVILHTPFFGASTQETDDYPFRDAFAPELSRLGIDVVLAGHQHVYCRAKMMNGTTPNDSYDYTTISEIENPELSDVLYMTIGSASGSAYNNLSTLGNHVVKAWKQNEPNISNVEITDTSFKISTYKTTDMDTVADEFTLKRTGTDPVARAVLVSPKTIEVKCGNSQTFTGEAFGYNLNTRAVTWSVSGNESSGTTISSSGVLTVAADETAENLTIVAASAEDPDGKTASVQVTLPDNAPVVVNVGQGVTYKLPETISGVSVSWENAAGEAATMADTSLVGYRMYRGKLPDGTFINYRVNVGEYKELMHDDFEAYTAEKYEIAVDEAITGGTFIKKAYENSNDKAQRLVKDGDNTVAAFGERTTAVNSFMWNPTDKAQGEAFKVSYKLKIASFDLDTAGVGTSSSAVNYSFVNNFSNTGAILIRTYVSEENGVRSVGDTQLRCDGVSAKNEVISGIEWTEPDENNIISMKDYITIEVEGNNVQYAARVNGNELVNSMKYKNENIGNNGITSIAWAKRNSANVDTVVYADELVYSKAIYVTDKLEKVPVSTALMQGDNSAQTTSVVLNMSDGTTKSFTVNYIADTADSGTKTAKGTIDGFDGSVSVTYTVVAATEPTTINKIENNDDAKTQVTINNRIALADGTKLFVAVYNASSAMQKLCPVNLDAAQRAAGEQVVVLSENLLDSANSIVKVFVWNNKLEPLCSMLVR